MSDSPAVILYDAYGNPFAVQNNPLRNDPVAVTPQPIVGGVVTFGDRPAGYKYKSQPTVIAGVDSYNTIQLLMVDGYGSLVSKPPTAQVGLTLNFSATTSNQTILNPNGDRKTFTIYNAGSTELALLYGYNSSSTNFTTIIEPYSFYQNTIAYIGNIDACWLASGTGFATVCEFI